jgi:hypothetical protein
MWHINIIHLWWGKWWPAVPVRHIILRVNNWYSAVNYVAMLWCLVRRDIVNAFWLMVFLTYDGFIRIQPHYKWRSIYIVTCGVFGLQNERWRNTIQFSTPFFSSVFLGDKSALLFVFIAPLL